MGEILRREGIYASQVASWRNSLEEVIANGLPEKKEAEKLAKQLARTQENLRQARLIIEAQKKIAEMYRTEVPDNDEDSL